MPHNIAILIPCRWASTRFPGKAVAPILGQPSIRWPVAAAIAAGYEPYLLTDDDRIADAADAPHVIMTGEADNGTDRCSQVVEQIDAENFIIISGDETCVTPQHIHALAAHMGGWVPAVGTLVTNIHEYGYSHAAISGDRMLYISRQPISDTEATGLYVYQSWKLADYTTWPQGPLEQLEGIELLRTIESFYEVHAIRDDSHPGFSLNYESQIPAIEEHLQNSPHWS